MSMYCISANNSIHFVCPPVPLLNEGTLEARYKDQLGPEILILITSVTWKPVFFIKDIFYGVIQQLLVTLIVIGGTNSTVLF